MASTDPIVSCEHLVKVYDSPTGRVQAVRGVDLEIERGVATAVAGPSGCGKSSLLRMVAGLDRPTAGRVTISGLDLGSLGAGRRARLRAKLLTHIYQRPGHNLIGHLSAHQQLLRLAGRGGGRRVDEILSSLEIEHRRHHRPAEMSGGELQRLAFARAVAAGHDLVIADEPTAELDAASGAAVMATIDVLVARGVTVIVATHDPRLLTHVEQVVLLRDGAVASVTAAGTELAVIDRSGRLQLPPAARARFADRKAVLHWDDESARLMVDPP